MTCSGFWASLSANFWNVLSIVDSKASFSSSLLLEPSVSMSIAVFDDEDGESDSKAS